MSVETNTATVEAAAPVAAPVASKKAPTPKAKVTAKPTAKKVAVKPAAKKVEAKAAPTPREKAPQTKPQLRILGVLAKMPAGKGLVARALAEKAEVAQSWITGFVRKACAANTTPSLMEQKLVKGRQVPVDGKAEGEWLYEATADGKKLVEKLAKKK